MFPLQQYQAGWQRRTCSPQIFKAKSEGWLWFATRRIPTAQEIVLEALSDGGGSFLSQQSGDRGWRAEQMLARFGGEGDSGQGKTLLG